MVTFILTITAINGSIYAYGGGESARIEVKNAQQWVKVGKWIGENFSSDARIATVIVGAIPYCFGLVTYDLTGLTSRQVAMDGHIYLEGKVGHQKYNTDYILTQ